MRVVSMGGGSGEGGEEGPESSGSESEGEGAPAGATFEQQVAAAQARKKAEAAKEFVRVYNLQKASGMGMAVDPKIMTAAERAGKLTPQLMAAIAATLDVPAAQTMVVAGGNTLMEAGKSAGMLTLGVPPSVAQRGGFSAADALFDGYGPGGGLTWHKAKLVLQKHQNKAAAQQQGRQGREEAGSGDASPCRSSTIFPGLYSAPHPAHCPLYFSDCTTSFTLCHPSCL